MIKLRTFSHQSEAHLAKSLLASHGVEAEIIGAKEYTAHVMGGDLGHYTLMVHDEDFNHAKAVIDKILKRDMMLAKEPDTDTNHFRKAVMFACGAMILMPIVFNVISLQHAWKYWNASEKGAEDILKVLFVIVLNIPTYFILKYAFTMMMGLPDEGAEF